MWRRVVWSKSTNISVEDSAEMLVDFNQTTRCHMPEARNLHSHHHENLMSRVKGCTYERTKICPLQDEIKYRYAFIVHSKIWALNNYAEHKTRWENENLKMFCGACFWLRSLICTLCWHEAHIARSIILGTRSNPRW